MAKFLRGKICAKLDERKMTKIALAELAGVCRQTVYRALEGESVTPQIAEKIARALGIDTVGYLDLDRPRPVTKKVTITRDDGKQKEVDFTAYYDGNGEVTSFASFGDDEDFRKAMRAYFYKPVKVEDLSMTPAQIIKKISGSDSKEVAMAVNAEIKSAEAQGYYLDTLGVAPDGRTETLLLFKKEG